MLELFEILQMVPKLIELIYRLFGIWYEYVCDIEIWMKYGKIDNLSRAKLQKLVKFDTSKPW